jgi:hypothetical protein
MMKNEFFNGVRCMWIVCLCLVLYGMVIIGCSSSSSDHHQTWKDKFPTLWSTAYAAEGDEPNPEDITYDEFLQAVVAVLQTDQAFLEEIKGETGPAGPQGEQGLQGPQGETGQCTCPITQEELDALVARVAELETKLASLSVGNDISGYSALTFSGVNIYINNGAGATDDAVNGTGNLIVGYNELRAEGNDRSGSHNIVIGMNNNYSSYGGVVSGYLNTISGEYAGVIGGSANRASGKNSTVTGGSGNAASGWSSSISGGENNSSSGPYCSVSGGYFNEACIGYSSVSGGFSNEAGYFSSISGGENNTANGYLSSISGGKDNTATGDYSSISGGSNNFAVHNYSQIGACNGCYTDIAYDFEAEGVE